MPTYTAHCPACDTYYTYIRRVADRNETPVCEDDGTQTERVLEAAMTPVMGIADHYQIVTSSGQTCYGKHEYEKYLKDNGLQVASEIKGEADYQSQEREKKVKRERREQLAQLVQQHLN